MLMEATIAIPFLFFVVTGVVELGRTLSLVAWVQQTAYQTAVAGGEVSGVAAIQNVEMQRVAARIHQIHSHERTRFNLNQDLVNFATQPLAANTNREVRVRLSGSLRGILPFYPLGVSVDMTGPVLVLSNAITTNLSTFSNPAVTQSCVSTNNCADPATCPCLQCHADHTCDLLTPNGACDPLHDPNCHP